MLRRVEDTAAQDHLRRCVGLCRNSGGQILDAHRPVTFDDQPERWRVDAYLKVPAAARRFQMRRRRRGAPAVADRVWRPAEAFLVAARAVFILDEPPGPGRPAPG